MILEPPEGGAAMLKVLIGDGLGFNPNARQIKGDLLSAAGDATAPRVEGENTKTIQELITDGLTDQDQE